uniref:Uncharacterized protein n=1 Tax=Anguilla anguilla TaxID=7936 RepID=A0A0E9SMR4_ANGAN
MFWFCYLWMKSQNEYTLLLCIKAKEFNSEYFCNCMYISNKSCETFHFMDALLPLIRRLQVCFVIKNKNKTL